MNVELNAYSGPSHSAAAGEQDLLIKIENALDHIEPEELARRVMAGQKDLIIADIRTTNEFSKFHIKTARHIPLKDLALQLDPYKNKGMIVLYSNGMTHPAQARDALFRMGFNNVYLLTDGLEGFSNQCLKPVSLRTEPVPGDLAEEINQWRRFFLDFGSDPSTKISDPGQIFNDVDLPGVIEVQQLNGQLHHPAVQVIDLRSQPEYNTGHIPGSLALNVESVRGNINGVPSCLLPATMLTGHLGLMGIEPDTRVILVYGDKIQDATLIGMAMERLGHAHYAVLNGGFAEWESLNMAIDTALPNRLTTRYPDTYKESFSIDYQKVLVHVTDKTALILDVRPTAYYTGEKSDEARAGHIPGAVNRPFDLDTEKNSHGVTFKPLTELAAIYENIIPSKQTQIIVHCRTGHQASQTFFVLKHLLKYNRVLWYDAGWTEWSARKELPIATGAQP